MSIVVKNMKVVSFPGGLLRVRYGISDAYINWGYRYEMLVFAGRGPVYFSDGDMTGGTTYGNMTEAFNKAAVRRLIRMALELNPGSMNLDERTEIAIRRINKSFEITLPCMEQACVTRSTLVRLLKELG